uniref:serine/arginine repetitive matrix protein 3-like n=1 Tax=Panthera onca TaxID=9690 RepID=UPI002953EB7A|nr:serine/arginine repetitive matrix protein 3-like [Panthera onca]
MATHFSKGSSPRYNEEGESQQAPDAQRLAQITHSTDGLGLRLASNSAPGAALEKLGTRPLRPRTRRQTLWARALANPGEATGVCASGRGARTEYEGGDDQTPAASAQPRPAAAAPLRPLPAPCPRSVLTHRRRLRRKFGGAAGAAAKLLDALRRRRRRRRRRGRGLRRRGSGGGGAPRGASRGGRRRPGPAGLRRPRLRLRAPRAAPTPGGGTRGRLWLGSDTFSRLLPRTPASGSAQRDSSSGLERRVSEGSEPWRELPTAHTHLRADGRAEIDEKTEAQIGEETSSAYTASKSFQEQTVKKMLNQVWNLDQSSSLSLFILVCLVEES